MDPFYDVDVSIDDEADGQDAEAQSPVDDESVVTLVYGETYELTPQAKEVLAQYRAESSAERRLLEIEERLSAALGGPGSWAGSLIDEACKRIESANRFRMETGIRCVERALRGGQEDEAGNA